MPAWRAQRAARPPGWEGAQVATRYVQAEHRVLGMFEPLLAQASSQPYYQCYQVHELLVVLDAEDARKVGRDWPPQAECRGTLDAHRPARELARVVILLVPVEGD